MSATEVALRFMAGGSVVVLVSVFARSSHPTLAGMAVLFPAVTLVSFAFLAGASSAEKLSRIATFAVYSLPATLSFLVTYAFAVERIGPKVGLSVAVLAWLAMAGGLLALNRLCFHL